MRILLFILLIFTVDFIYLEPARTESVKQPVKQMKHGVKNATIDCKYTMKIFGKTSCDNEIDLREVVQEKINIEIKKMEKGSIVENTEVIPIVQDNVKIGYLIKVHYNYLE